MLYDAPHHNHAPTDSKFTEGLPTEQGWYWIKCRGIIEPCRVMLGVGTNVAKHVKCFGWGNGSLISIDCSFIEMCSFAPMNPPVE